LDCDSVKKSERGWTENWEFLTVDWKNEKRGEGMKMLDLHGKRVKKREASFDRYIFEFGSEEGGKETGKSKDRPGRMFKK